MEPWGLAPECKTASWNGGAQKRMRKIRRKRKSTTGSMNLCRYAGGDANGSLVRLVFPGPWGWHGYGGNPADNTSFLSAAWPNVPVEDQKNPIEFEWSKRSGTKIDLRPPLSAIKITKQLYLTYHPPHRRARSFVPMNLKIDIHSVMLNIDSFEREVHGVQSVFSGLAET